ncbi:MAG: alpha amylase [Rhodospirillaceae bacterium]|nr:MAG: alpha amylase [Rhodospirillaceae bacterium]
MAFVVPAWVRHAVFYQIFPDRFARSTCNDSHNYNLEEWDTLPTHHGYKGGTLRGPRDRLDYLQDFGINALYLNPIFQSSTNHRYHTCDYFQVDPLLGGNAAFDNLLAAAHGKGMRVILDGVFNHVGRCFFPFNDLIENGPASAWGHWF